MNKYILLLSLSTSYILCTQEKDFLEKAHEAVEEIKEKKNNEENKAIVELLKMGCYKFDTSWTGYIKSIYSGEEVASIEKINIKDGNFNNCTLCHAALRFALLKQEINTSTNLEIITKRILNTDLDIKIYKIMSAECIDFLNKRIDRLSRIK